MLTAEQRALLERSLGRALTDAELHVDVAGIDRTLEQAKNRLELLIEAEKRRAVRRTLRGRRLRLDVTGEMEAVLAGLYREGRRHAEREMRSMGVEPARGFAVDPVERRHLEASLARLRDGLGRLEVRVERETLTVSIGEAAAAAVRRRLLQVPGARDAASRVVSGAFTAGLAATYEEADAQGLFDGWQITAVLDGGTCGPCREDDGKVFATLVEAYQLLPNFGPNVRCRGGTRCRCRLVPVGAAGGGSSGGGGGARPPAPPGEPPEPPDHPERIPGAEAAWIPAGKAVFLLTARGKRRYFVELLGFNPEHPEELERELLRTLPKSPGRFAFVNRAGRNQWVTIARIAGPRAEGDVFSAWQIMEDDAPAFVTARPARTADRLRYEL